MSEYHNLLTKYLPLKPDEQQLERWRNNTKALIKALKYDPIKMIDHINIPFVYYNDVRGKYTIAILKEIKNWEHGGTIQFTVEYPISMGESERSDIAAFACNIVNTFRAKDLVENDVKHKIETTIKLENLVKGDFICKIKNQENYVFTSTLQRTATFQKNCSNFIEVKDLIEAKYKRNV